MHAPYSLVTALVIPWWHAAGAGTMFERIQVVCNNQQDLQDWVGHLTRQTKHTAATGPSHKPLNMPCHTVSIHHAHTFPMALNVKCPVSI